MAISLYERIGGESAIMAAVDLFYKKVIDDDVTRPFFAGMEMDALTKKQVAFLAWAFGGPVEYRGRDLTVAHASLVRDRGLTDVHFDAVAKHLEATLRELGLGDDIVGEVLGAVGSLRGRVLGRPG
jgi:hemoglobin